MVDTFKYNINLRAAGTKSQFDPYHIDEYAKCKLDPIYFIETYVYIVSPDKGLALFKMYPCQRQKVLDMMNHRRCIFMEGRQQGKTTTVTAFILWYVLFQKHKTALIMSNKSKSAMEIMSRFKIMYENLPFWMQSGVIKWNEGSVELENGSRVYADSTTPTSGRSRSANLVYIDETAHIGNHLYEAFASAINPVISAGKTTKMIQSSTPKGFNHFWKTWDGANPERPTNGYFRRFIHYSEIPGRDEKWLKEQLAELGETGFNQEVLCKFIGSTRTLIRGDVLEQMAERTETPMYENKDSIDGLQIFHPPEKGRNYMMTIDVASGIGKDASAFVIFDISEFPYRVVGKYRDNAISPTLFPDIIYKLAMEYNEAYTLVEINNNETVAYILQQELEYENVLFINRAKTGGQRLGAGFGETTNFFGLNMDKRTKRIGCHTIKTIIEDNKLMVKDRDIVSELSTFVETKGTFQADDTYHDDLVMCLVMFGWATSQPYFSELNNVDIRRKMLEARRQAIEEDVLDFYVSSVDDSGDRDADALALS